jgi:hypothetical protein
MATARPRADGAPIRRKGSGGPRKSLTESLFSGHGNLAQMSAQDRQVPYQVPYQGGRSPFAFATEKISGQAAALAIGS